MMSFWRLAILSLTYHWRINLAVAFGVAAATAVLTGALLVGDSVKGSLRHLTLERLGEIDEVLVTDRFFREALADELTASEDFIKYYDQAAPAILFPSTTIELKHAEQTGRSTNVLIVGCNASFWEMGDEARPTTLPGDDEIVLNQALADDLNATVSSEVVARLPKGNQVPADSPLANKSDRIRSLPGLKVVDVIPARGLGRFSLRPSQSTPLVAFVSIATLQDVLDQDGKINSLLVSLKPNISPTSDEAQTASKSLASAFHPSFEDYGLAIKRVTRTFKNTDSEPETVYDYFSVTSDRMILSPEAELVAEKAFAPMSGQGVVTYLATKIEKESGREGESENRGAIAYSMISGVDVTDDFPLLDLQGKPIDPLKDNEIILNSWAAADQDAKLGDTIRVTYFEAETAHGDAVETHADFTVKAITPLTEPSRSYRPRREAEYTQRPTLANDPDLTPEVEGVTDQETIDSWDAPFPFDRNLLREQDNTYWDNHRTTPKAFVSLVTGERLWGSRFGRVTAIRIPAQEGVTSDSIKQAFTNELAKQGESLGMDFMPVKRQQLAASSGTTPFDGLFLGLSFFIIAAALLLVALLFRLGVEQRASEIGTLLAVGLRRSKTSRLFVAEGALVAIDGGVLGVAIGVGYAWLMLAGLRTWWVGAITTPFLEFYWSTKSLLLGYGLGVLVSVLTISWSIRQTKKLSTCRLLAGQVTDAHDVAYKAQNKLSFVSLVCIAVAVGLAAMAVRLGGMAQAGAFLGAGFLMLTGLLLFVWLRLKRGGRRELKPFTGGWALTKLALRNAGRNPGRSVTTIGLMATASFLIVGLSSFRLAPSNEGAGGFDLVAQSSESVFVDLNSEQGREEILADKNTVLEGGLAFGLRFKPGDDASCNNLYRSTQPRVIGLTDSFVQHFDAASAAKFRWMQTEASSDAEKSNPWRLLAKTNDAAIPVVIDMNTAMYSLKPPANVGTNLELTYDDHTIRFHVVGLLENSVLQGSLLIREADFERLFPDVSGYRYFLIQSPPGKSKQVAEVLEDRLSDQGFDAVPSSQMLEQLFAVQNTYLSTFQSLGALGLLLGTFGLAAVQMRNVLERRGELALLRATGFREKRLAQMVLLENVLLLVGGLATGTVAATLAVLPHKLTGNASIPTDLLRDLGLMLLAVLVVGVLSSLISVRSSLKVPVLSALRGE
ncbi:MAG: FtsX-like permease family protein [Planctomycetaceae bacterium]|nr:FtsX-like permease family protein [Planctomycetaceae bacterium]